MTRQELEKLKQEYAALKRNYDSISSYAARDNAEMVALKKANAALENQLKALRSNNGNFDDTLEALRRELEAMRAANRELNCEIEAARYENSKLKQEVARLVTMAGMAASASELE